MESHLEFTRGLLRKATQLHLMELIEEIHQPSRPLTMLYVDDLLHRMVISGSSPDCILHGAPMAIAEVQKEILIECARRWQKLIETLRIEEKPAEWPYKTHEVNFPTAHFEGRFGKIN